MHQGGSKKSKGAHFEGGSFKFVTSAPKHKGKWRNSPRSNITYQKYTYKSVSEQVEYCQQIASRHIHQANTWNTTTYAIFSCGLNIYVLCSLIFMRKVGVPEGGLRTGKEDFIDGSFTPETELMLFLRVRTKSAKTPGERMPREELPPPFYRKSRSPEPIRGSDFCLEAPT